MPSIGAIGDYPVSSYNSPQFSGGNSRAMVHNTEQAFVAMPLPSSLAKTQNTAQLNWLGSAVMLALTGRDAAAVKLTAFIAYSQNLQANAQSVLMGYGVRVFSLGLHGTSTGIDQSKAPTAPFSHMKALGINAVTMLPGPPFITIFLVNSLSKVSMRGYRTIWQFLEGASASAVVNSPGLLFERFLWAVRSGSKVMGRVAEVGTLPLVGKILTVVKARRSQGVSPLTMPGARSLIAWKTYPGIERIAYLGGRAKSRLVDSLADYTGLTYFKAFSKSVTRVRLSFTGRIRFAQSVSITKASMRTRGPMVKTYLDGQSNIRFSQDTSEGRFLVLALLDVLTKTMSVFEKAGVSIAAKLTGHSEGVIRAKTARLFSNLGIQARSGSLVMSRAVFSTMTYLRARTKSMVVSSVPVIFGTFLLLRGRVRMAAHASAQTMAAKVVLHGFSALKDHMHGLTRYTAFFGAQTKSQVRGRMPILPFQLIDLPATVSAFVSRAGGAAISQFSLMTAVAWQALMGNLTPMSWPLLPNMQPGRHVCNTRQRIRYIYRNLLDQDECECQQF